MAEQTCLRCGAPYEEGATVCFTCGAPIGEIETPTQPVRTPKRAAPETTVMPAIITPTRGATSGANRGAVGARAATSAARGGRAAVSGAGRGGPAPRSGQGRLAGRPRLAPPPPPRRIRWPIYLVIAVVVVLFIGAGAIETRALLASPPIPKTQTYHDAAHRFSFTRPGLWQVNAEPDGALLTDSAGVDSAQIAVLPVPAAAPSATGSATAATPTATPAPVVAAADAQAAQLGLGAAATQPPQTFAGAVWQQRAGQVTGGDNVIREVDLLVTIHAGQLYVITLRSPITSFNSTNNLVYQPLLASFSFS